MLKDQPHWLAGPVSYSVSENPDHRSFAWEFIGGTAGGRILRWKLAYAAKSREFSVTVLNVTQWDQAHCLELRDFYQPCAVARVDLPKGSILVALKAMLPPREIAAATARSIAEGTR